MGRYELTRVLAALGAAVLAAALLGGCGGSGATDGSEQLRERAQSPLLEFGEEGSGSELEEAEAIVSDFLAARAEENWPAACDALAKPILDKLKRLATTSTELEDTSCPSFLDAFLAISPQEKKEVTTIEVGSLRHQGAKGYLIYSGSGDAVYAMPLDRQGDEWRVAELAAKRLGEP